MVVFDENNKLKPQTCLVRSLGRQCADPTSEPSVAQTLMKSVVSV